jgi:hypothetical protein
VILLPRTRQRVSTPPLDRMLPATVIVLSLFCIYMYSEINIKVVPFTALLYAGGLAYYWFRGHGRIQKAAPEELAARTTPALRVEVPG